MKHFATVTTFGRKHLNMINAVVNFAFSPVNAAITATVAMLLTFMNRLKDNQSAIDNLLKISKNPITGYTQQKDAARVNCIEISIAVMDAALAFAVETNNLILAQQMNTSRSALLQMKQSLFGPYIQNAYDNAFAFKTELEDYGVTAGEFTQWNASITAWNNILSAPANQKAIRKQANAEIQEILKASMLLLYNQVDTLVHQVQDKAYIQEYFNNRKLQPLVKHTKFRIAVTNELNQPIYGVTVQQDGTERVAATDMMGDATLYIAVEHNPEQQPVYSFTIRNGSQVISTGNILIKRGHTVSRSYVMQPSGFILPEPVSETSEPSPV